jgi:predicted MFS family arabinose efflux permease
MTSTLSPRRTAVTLLSLIFVLTIVLSAMVPLLPRFVDRFDLTTVQAGALYSIVTLVMLTCSVPVGMLADRFGPKPLALGAVGFLVLSCFLQGFASDYPMLLAGRLVFGVAHTTIWASVLTWLAQLELTPRWRSFVLGGTLTVSGAAFSIGPLFVGLTVDRFGTFFPFAVAAVLALVVAAALTRASSPPRVPAGQRPHFRETVGTARREPYVTAALLLLAISGAMTIGGALLIPLQLHRNGLSSAQIGVVFSVMGICSVVVGATVNRFAERTAKPIVGAFCLGWIALVALLPAANQSTWALLGFLALSVVATTTVVTIPYPIGGEGARRAGLQRGAVMGALNSAWALSATLAPLIGGAIAQGFGFHVTWVVVSAVMASGCVLCLRVARRKQPLTARPVADSAT